MMCLDLCQLLRENAYPGRGIALGRSADGRRVMVVYFIMGRSENSRNRVFEETEDGIRTQAFDGSRMTDPSLIIYHPVRRLPDGLLVVTNGDHTDTIRDAVAQGRCYRHALNTRTFEPDGPNWTPRISGVVKPDGSYNISILKTLDGDPSCCGRYFFEYDRPVAGTGHFISTYQGDGSPLPSFWGEPRLVAFGDRSAQELAGQLWEAMDKDNKVSLYVETRDISGGERDTVIVNKHR